MDVANITRERISIDKTVAQEEERIKEVREVSEADRQKQVLILEAEAKAQESLVREVKEAQARETASKHRAVELTTLAQAEHEAAGKQAEAKRLLADAYRAEQAAPGLAEAQRA
uniref:Flotillin n=1 Tax=Panagrolaimus superbus TaxID=310955 RepID=A0A914Z9T5_9BILA